MNVTTTSVVTRLSWSSFEVSERNGQPKCGQWFRHFFGFTMCPSCQAAIDLPGKGILYQALHCERDRNFWLIQLHLVFAL